MLSGDGITTGDAAIVQTVIGLFETRMHCAQAVQSLPELGRQPTVGLGRVGEERVTASGRAVQQI